MDQSELSKRLAGDRVFRDVQFAADTVNVDLSGLGNASVTAHQNANLSLSGLGSVTVYGKPLNRKVSVDGLGKVSWK